MQFKNWVAKTASVNPRTVLAGIDLALQAFNRSGTESDLAKVQIACNQWLSGHPTALPSTAGNIDLEVRQLLIWVDDRMAMFTVDKQKLIPMFQQAAQKILDAYGSQMEPHYRSELESNFVTNTGHVYCYKRYATASDWTKRCSKLLGSKTLQATDTLTAATPTLSPATAVIDGTMVESWRNLKSDTPPSNRRIEFQNINLHTTVHEMLHWCCHENFRLQAGGRSLGKDGEYVLEGFTEWLARNALNQWTSNSYLRIMETVIACVKAGHPTPSEIFKAYFGGQNVLKLAQDTIVYINQVYLPALAINWTEVDRVVPLMAGRTRTTPSVASSDFQDTVVRAFKGVPEQAAQQKLAKRAEWFAFVKGKNVLA